MASETADNHNKIPNTFQTFNLAVDRAMELLRSWGWTEAWWESYNPSVQFVYSEGGRVT